MNSRLKERLIGAAVLVVLGVWLIPWVLDGPETTADVSEEALQLPTGTRSVPVRTQTIDLAGRRAETDSDSETDSQAEPAAAPSRRDEATTAAAPAVVPSAAPSPEVSAASADPPAAPGAAQPDPAPARAESGWVVQIGSFGQEDNARRLAERAATYGHVADVSTYRAGGRTMHRVRIGPGRSRNEAEAVASSLTAHGFVAQVVRLD